MMAFNKLIKIHRRTDAERLTRQMADAFEEKQYPERYAQKKARSRQALAQFAATGMIIRSMLPSNY